MAKVLYQKWAIVFNTTKNHAAETAARLQKVLEHFGAQVQIFERCPDDLRGYHALATIGGDGTILGCVNAVVQAQIPVVGINMGTLGYLASVDRNRLEESFEKILQGGYRPLQRLVLELQLPDGRKHWALNDVVVKSAEYRLAELKVSADDELITEYPCDGLIFATPTGASAYNLSAGGPLIHHQLQGFVMTPICAHTLTERSVMFGPKNHLKIDHGRHKRAVHINIDGRTVCEGTAHLPMFVGVAGEHLTTLEDPQNGQFAVLRKKLGW